MRYKNKHKRDRYRDIIAVTLAKTYDRMERLLSTVPLNADLDKDPIARETIYNVMAIEEEWIVDPDLREELTLVDIDES